MHTGATSRKWMLVLANLDEFGVRLRDVGPPAVYFPISLFAHHKTARSDCDPIARQWDVL